METTTSSQVQQVCTFHVDSLFLGVDVTVVQEVIRFQEITSVPLARKAVQGLINLRGQIVTAIDLRTQLDLPPIEAGTLPMNVVIRTKENMASLLVDEIGDVVDIDPTQLEPPPSTLPDAARKYITSVYKMDGRLLLLLDPDQAVRITEQNAPGKRESKTRKAE